MIAAARVAGHLRRRHSAEPLRQLAVAGVLLGTVVLTFALPADTDPLEVPAGLLWQFRWLAPVSALLLWSSLGVVFGLRERADHPRPVTAGERVLQTQ